MRSRAAIIRLSTTVPPRVLILKPNLITVQALIELRAQIIARSAANPAWISGFGLSAGSLQQGRQRLPYVLQQYRLRRRGRMHIVRLKQLAPPVRALEHEGNERRLVLAREIGVDLRELPRIGFAVIGRHAHADEQNPGLGPL